MSSSCRPKPKSFRSDIHRLLQAAEAGQKADVLTYFSGHLGPRSLNQSQPHMDTKQSFWKVSKSQEETPNPLTVQRRTKTLTYVQDQEMKEFPSEFTTSTTAVDSEISESRQAQASDQASHADGRGYFRPPNAVHRSLNFVPFQLSALSQKTQHFLSNPEGKQHGLNNEDQLKTKQWFGRESGAKQDPWVGINVAAMHERKLHKGLKKLSAQSWPSRDRLAVFSDVFDDVCECSPVFGRILREIKTDYDLYVNHLMATQSPPPHDMVLNPSLEGFGNGKVREMEMEDAEKEICRLELEARRALKENKRVRKELQKVPAFTGPMDSGMKRLQDTGASIRHTNSVQLKRLQVLNMWREIQQLEEELKEKLVPNDTTADAEKHIKDLKTETLRLIALNDRLRTNNQKLKNKINMVLEGEKSNKTTRRAFWDKMQCDLWTKR